MKTIVAKAHGPIGDRVVYILLSESTREDIYYTSRELNGLGSFNCVAIVRYPTDHMDFSLYTNKGEEVLTQIHDVLLSIERKRFFVFMSTAEGNYKTSYIPKDEVPEPEEEYEENYEDEWADYVWEHPHTYDGWDGLPPVLWSQERVVCSRSNCSGLR